MQKFKENLKQDLLQEHNLEAFNLLKNLAEASSIEGVIDILLALEHAKPVRIVVHYRSLWLLFLENPAPFISKFSKEALKALLYQACKLGELALVKQLIDSMHLEVTQTKISSPDSTLTVYENNQYQFHNPSPVLYAAVESNSLALVAYILRFYNLQALDKEAVEGELQKALYLAAKANAQDVVKHLLELGINVNSAVKEGYCNTTGLDWAIINKNEELIKLLVDNGATVSSLNQYHLVNYGLLSSIKYLESKSIHFAANINNHDSLEAAIESGSTTLVDYLINTLKHQLYHPALKEPSKKYRSLSLIKSVMKSGSIEMLDYLEKKLELPVSQIISEQINTQNDKISNDFLLTEAVCNYRVELVQYLFETKRLMPNIKQLYQLVNYAYDSGLWVPLHRKFTMHAYLMSFIHTSLDMKNIFKDVAKTESLNIVSAQNLFILYHFYKKKYQTSRTHDSENLLRHEILNGQFKLEDLLNLSNKSSRIAEYVLFFMVSSKTRLSAHLFEFIKQSKSLTSLNFDCSVPDFMENSADFVNLLEALTSNRRIEHINFEQQPLGERGVTLLIKALTSKPSRVYKINLCNTQLTKKAADEIINFLEANKSIISVLITKENDITDAQLVKIQTLCNLNNKAARKSRELVVEGLFGSINAGLPVEICTEISNYLGYRDGKKLAFTIWETFNCSKTIIEDLPLAGNSPNI